MAHRLTARLVYLAALAALGGALVGCASFWDDVKSSDFKIKDLYSRPDPLTVLRTRQDEGDAFARAMRDIKEPAKNGGTQQDQDEVLKILAQAATQDTRPLCRLSAIDALGRFHDPRATSPLIQAYQNAAAATFTTDHATAIRCEALTALGHKKQPEVAAILLQAAAPLSESKPPTVQQTGFTNDILRRAAGTSNEQAAREIRLAALRALGDLADPQSIPALLAVLQEKDAAIHDRAHQALQKVSGRKDVPPDAQEWQKVLARGTPAKP